jgi:hydrogenase maturation protease
MWARVTDLLGPADAQREYEVGTTPPCPVLVLGMGNVLLEDEGLGIHALKLLQQRYRFSPDVEFLDGGTSGMSLVDQISSRAYLLVLDAVQTGEPPGTLVKMSDQDVPVYFGTKVTFHQLGLSDVLASLALSDEQPAHITVLGLVPDSLELSLEPSEKIRSRLDELVEAAAAELEALGCLQ